MMGKNIIIEQIKSGQMIALNVHDIYHHIPKKEKERETIACFIERWCEFLNYKTKHEKELLMGDFEVSLEAATKEAWLDGYNHNNFAKITEYDNRVEIEMLGYVILLYKPTMI